MQGIRLTEKQKEYVRNANARWNLKVGAVRSGKTYLDVCFMIPYRIRQRAGKDGLNVIMGVSKETIERNVLQPMRELYTDEIVGTINNRNIAMICGEEVYCLGAEKVSQVAKIQGMSIKYCYGDEIAKWNKDVFQMLKSRLDKPYSKFDGACNPEYPSHWLKEFIDDENIDSYIQKYTIFDNCFLDDDFVKNLCKEYEGTVFYSRYILGEWALAEGLIFPLYDKCYGEPPLDSRAQEYCISLDYGTMNAFAALLWEKHRGVWYNTNWYYYSGRETGVQKTDAEYLKDLEVMVKEVPRIEGEKIRTIVDPSAASFIALLRKSGVFKVQKGDNAILDGIRETAVAMQKGIIKISPNNKAWTKEAGGYRWDEKSGEDRPIQEADHCLTGDTLVDTTGGQIPIRELVGKEGCVYSYDGEKAVVKPFKDVRKTQENVQIYRVTVKDGRSIDCTAEHPILTESGWKQAKELTIQDFIIDIKQGNVHIANIKRLNKQDVYNMEVDDTHCFSVNGGLIVHNCMDAMRYFVKTKNILKPYRRRGEKI